MYDLVPSRDAGKASPSRRLDIYRPICYRCPTLYTQVIGVLEGARHSRTVCDARTLAPLAVLLEAFNTSLPTSLGTVAPLWHWYAVPPMSMITIYSKVNTNGVSHRVT